MIVRIFWGGLLCTFFSVGLPVWAAVPNVYTADNFLLSEHDQPKSFWSDGAGGFGGVTMSGKSFTQQPVVADMHVGLQRFSIDDASFYVSNLGLIYAETDTVALSIYLARAGWEEEVV
jgi:hypothetical protein